MSVEHWVEFTCPECKNGNVYVSGAPILKASCEVCGHEMVFEISEEE